MITITLVVVVVVVGIRIIHIILIGIGSNSLVCIPLPNASVFPYPIAARCPKPISTNLITKQRENQLRRVGNIYLLGMYMYFIYHSHIGELPF